MINFDLFRKEDIALLLEGFDTSFLQAPIRHLSKAFSKYIPNGFRAEKLMRSQLVKVYMEALYAREPGISELILNEISRNLEKIGVDSYMAERMGKDYPIGTYTIEISCNVFENHLIIPAHIVLMLYGIECTVEEKELSERLHKVFHSQRDEAKQEGYEDGFKQGEIKVANDLEAERKKNAKLQKTIDSTTLRTKNNAEVEKQRQMESQKHLKEIELKNKTIDELSAALTEHQRKLALLESSERDQESTIATLKLELNKANEALETAQKQLSILIEEANEKFTISADEFKSICIEAINLISVKATNKSLILDIAKNEISSADDIKTAWNKLCVNSNAIISELYDVLLSEGFEQSHFDKFTELEGLLVLESAIQKALCSVAHKVMASSVIGNTMYSSFEVQG